MESALQTPRAFAREGIPLGLAAVLVWAPLYLSDGRLRALFPLRRST